MKLRAQFVLLATVVVAIAFTYGFRADPDEPVPGTGPIAEPYAVTLRSCAKDVIVRWLIENDLSLIDAAAMCRDIYRELPDTPGVDYTVFDRETEQPPMTADERFCRRVIGWVESFGNSSVTVARLEAEFRDWRSRGNALPDASTLNASPAELLKLARTEWQAQCSGRRRPVATSGECVHCE